MRKVGLLLAMFIMIGSSGCTITNKKDTLEEQENVLSQFKEEIQNTEKVVLAFHNDNGDILGLDGWTYKEKQVITNEETITKIIDIIEKSTVTNAITDDYIGKLIQFYDEDNQLIAEYEGHYLINKDHSIGINLDKNFNSLLYLFEQ